MPAQLAGPAFELASGAASGAGIGAGAGSGSGALAGFGPWGAAAAIGIPLLMGLFGLGSSQANYPPPEYPSWDELQTRLNAQNQPPANTHGIGESGMTPEQLRMINPRTQVSQALLQQRMRR